MTNVVEILPGILKMKRQKSNLIHKSPVGRNGQQLQCHICCSIADLVGSCLHKPDNIDNTKIQPK